VLSLAQLLLVGTGVVFYLIQAPAWLVFWSFVLMLAGYIFTISAIAGTGG
jgi:hypothetical protein